MRKKKWKQPKLIIFLRIKPEESILALCKAIDGSQPAVAVVNDVKGCWNADDEECHGSTCTELSAS